MAVLSGINAWTMVRRDNSSRNIRRSPDGDQPRTGFSLLEAERYITIFLEALQLDLSPIVDADSKPIKERLNRRCDAHYSIGHLSMRSKQ